MKKERGSITILTLTTVLFMVAFLVSTFTIVANKRQAQAEIKKETKDIYEEDVENVEQIYSSYFAEANEAIPIYTTEQLLKIGTDELIAANGKIYRCTPNANYRLKRDISFSVEDYQISNPNSFDIKTWTESEEQTVPGTDFQYTGSQQTYTAPATGRYKLEVWGAQGGYYNATYGTGGLGGYSIGTIQQLSEGDELYVYVGQQGGYKTATGNASVTNGYNGGGGASLYGGTGGGATDIRITGGVWNNSASLLSRIIVAGGGRRCTGKSKCNK